MHTVHCTVAVHTFAQSTKVYSVFLCFKNTMLNIEFLLQKLLEERSPVSLSSPPAKSCPNIAVRCDIVEYL